ncbi:YbhB/YbcL family Raf kinase inhibitor-like protein [Arthrobacter sp. 35W]|uniref:YbhB/YbcL family Raf kinase inhibitor-like protein n=1 Tax=Arthrobacter sp. 35W TaxID=1132441 RepID=UPI0004060045|nr:YbhB/YbcL family Raf kinase inhibitor-like protein [Arthrobacter sp. 35W]
MASDPFDIGPAVPAFELASTSFAPGGTLPQAQLGSGAGGRDLSPQLSWHGQPAATRSFAVTMFDPDAPGPHGFWHWAVANIPASMGSLPEGAATAGSWPGLPADAVVLKNDGGFRGYMGAAPPRGHGRHRYLVVVHAVDVEDLGVPADATPAALAAALNAHTLARGRLVGVYER